MSDYMYPVSPKKLGHIYHTDYCEFRIWAPTQERIFVAIYENNQCVHRELYPMEKDEEGVFETSIDGDMEGKYYTFIVGDSEVTDPYAVALGENSLRCVVVNLATTNPEGWEEHVPLNKIDHLDAIIYEVHLDDFVGQNSPSKGTYLGLIEDDKSKGQLVKGIAHLKELGITHLQLMPINDFLTVDEGQKPRLKDNYNWGYDPEHYNVPEGSYSSCAAEPKKRILELKEMIMKLQQEGFRVIVDVVFNHTYRGVKSNFQVVVPNYYYRTYENGEFSNGSGCGNELATERPMVRRFIIDSLIYWATEFKIDGFRFDLMALIDIETVRELMKILKWINKEIVIYGEPWAAGESVLPFEERTMKGKQSELELAFYNDSFRDAIKGGNDDDSRGFIQGNCDKKNAVETGIAGSIRFDDYHVGFANSPKETLNYVNSHDNLILHDKLKVTFPFADEGTLIRLNKLAMSILFTSQGIPLIHAGNEFLRTKQMDRNSYKSPRRINEIDWSNKEKYYNFYLYVKDVIALRKSYPCLRMSSASEIKECLTFVQLEQCVIAYTIKEKRNTFDYLVVIHNPLEKGLEIPIGKLFVEMTDMKTVTVTKVFDEEGIVPMPTKGRGISAIEVSMQASAIYEVSFEEVVISDQ